MSNEDMNQLKLEVDSWSLASDCKLLEYLQNFSSNLTDKTKSFVGKVEELTFDVAESEVCLRNTFNEFLMLGNSQFIENRVYDDDDGDEEEKKDEEEVKASDDPFLSLKEAFTTGQEAFKLFYFEENQDEKFEDIYNTRPLPYIIGTQLFLDSIDAGLGGIFEEDEPDHQNEQANSGIRQSRSGRDDFGEDEDEEDEEEGDRPPPVAQPRRTPAHYDEEEEEDDDYGAPAHRPVGSKPKESRSWSVDDESDGERVSSAVVRKQRASTEDDDDDEDVPPPPKKSGNSLKDVLNAQIKARSGGGEAVTGSKPMAGDSEDEEEDTSFSNKPPQKAAARKEESFQDEEEEEDDLFAVVEDDPYSLFGSGKPSAFKKSTTKTNRDSLQDLFGDLGRERSDSGSSTDSSALGFGNGSSTGKNKRNSFSGLFGDGNDDSLFDEVQAPKPTVAASVKLVAPEAAVNESSRAKPKVNFDDLFGSSAADEDDELPAKSAPVVAEKPAAAKPGVRGLGASDLFGSGGLFGDDDDSEGGLFSNQKPKSAKTTNPVINTTTTTTSKPAPASAKSRFASLFGDDDADEDSLFADSAPKKTAVVVAAAAKPSEKKKSSIFGDDDDDDGLFGDSKLKAKPAVEQAVKTAPVVAATVQKPQAASSLFDADDDEPDVFVAKPKPVAAVVTSAAPASKAPLVKKASIFDDDSEDDADLFGSKPKPVAGANSSPKLSAPPAAKKTAPEPPTKSQQSSLFADDEDDSESLFGATKPKSVSVAHPPVQVPPAASKAPLVKKTSIFDDDDDEDDGDLFGSKPKPTTSVAVVAQKTHEEVTKPSEDSVKGDNSASVSAKAVGRPVGGVALPMPPNRRVAAVESDAESDDEPPAPPSGPAVVEPVRVALPIAALRPQVAESESSDEEETAPHDKAHQHVVSAANESVAAVSEVVAPAASVVLAPPAESPSLATTNKRVSGGLASRLAGLDPSKIIMPGQAMPPRKKNTEPLADEGDAPVSKAKEEAPTASGDQSLSSVASTRAVVSKPRRAPTKKSFASEDKTSDLLGSAPLNTEPAKATKSSIFGDDEEDSFPAAKPAPVATAPVQTAKATKSSIFGDDEEDSFPAAKPTPVAAAPVQTAKATKSSIFGDDEEDSFPAAKPAPVAAAPVSQSVSVKKSVGGLFGDESGDPLFGGSAVAAKPVPSSAKKADLFGDEDSFSLFGPATAKASSVASAAPKKSSSLFGDDGDDPLFGGAVKAKAADPKVKKTSSSLFGDDDDDGLFGSKSKATSAVAPKKTTKGLFDD